MATVTRERELQELVTRAQEILRRASSCAGGWYIGEIDAFVRRVAALAAPPAEDARDYVAELRECHELLASCVGGVDPDEHPGLVARINVVLGGCDVAGVCPAPVDPVPGSVDYWREVAARLGAEVKLMADALKGTTEQRDDALAKLTAASDPPASRTRRGWWRLVRDVIRELREWGDGDAVDNAVILGFEQRLADLSASPQAETPKGDE